MVMVIDGSILQRVLESSPVPLSPLLSTSGSRKQRWWQPRCQARGFTMFTPAFHPNPHLSSLWLDVCIMNNSGSFRRQKLLIESSFTLMKFDVFLDESVKESEGGHWQRRVFIRTDLGCVPLPSEGNWCCYRSLSCEAWSSLTAESVSVRSITCCSAGRQNRPRCLKHVCEVTAYHIKG